MEPDFPPTQNMTIWNGLERLSSLFVVGIQLIAITAMLIVPVLAWGWLQHPFMGVLVENTLMINSSGPTQPGSWDAYAQGLRFGSQVIALDGTQVSDIHHLNALLSGYQPGDSVNLKVLTRSGGEKIYSVTLEKMSIQDIVSYLVIPYLIGLVSLATGLWVFTLRRRDTTGKAFALFSASIALAVSLLFDVYTTNWLVYIWVFSLAFIGGSLITLGFLFPEEDRIVSQNPWLRWIGYLPSLLIFGYAIPWQYNVSTPYTYADSWRYAQLYAILGFIFFTGWTIYRWRKSPSPQVREQSRLILIGTITAFSLVVGWFILTSTRLDIPFSPFLLIPIIIFPISIAYNLTRYRLLQTDYIARQVLLYSTLSLLAAIGYSLVVTGITMVFGQTIDVTNPFVIGTTVFILAFALLPIRERLQQIINLAFNRGQELSRQRLQDFSHKLTQALDVSALNSIIRQYLDKTISPNQIHIYLNPPGEDNFVALQDENGRPTSDLIFTIESGLSQMLASQRSAIYLGDMQTLPTLLYEERARLGLLGSHLYIPLPGRQRLIGWLGLGPHRSGLPYTHREIGFLETISDQAALAFERAQVIQDLEKRVHQMNILTRITQGINITATFDDILELIYTQTNLILPTRDFRISLLDERSRVLIYTFFLENDERLLERENQAIPQDQGLDAEVMKQSRPFMTDDYERECRIRGVLPDARGLYSWIGVPLNSGAETIGVISLGSRDPALRYTTEQANLLLAVADQAAGAIVKARLLEEAERRARQLATLNEVARSMSSTLELRPLFNQILISAVEILNCDAGSLLLIDEDTGEYVFESVVGPVASNLYKSRLAPGTGLVGKAVNTRQSIIVNDVRRSQDWFEQSDRETGFTTSDMLVVPMIYRDEVIGVIEVLNRKDGLPFTRNDQELLSAFASQAAVAMENARLFTLTDQTLAERVDELSVLQRIDRELNTSLDVDRAMRVTLEWAMRVSQADAGLIGIVEEDRANIMASQGYTNELTSYKESGLPLDLPTIQDTLKDGLPHFAAYDPQNGGSLTVLLAETRQQVVIPIRREQRTIGLVLLESRQPGTEEDEKIGFLTRLSDHASIAITNARLYNEVQAANQAKSDFISLVSHELKTPMTSIRGFTDLIASGVVGTINENQSNFLNTIRSNVDRMATLVTDLADVSRIEAGRLRLETAAISVSDVVDEVVRSTRSQILEKKQTLIVQPLEGLPPIWGDRTRLIQILTNLVSNAHKYTQPEGLIQISAELANNIWTDGSPQVIHIAVKDNGYGIDDENQQKIFTKFFRSDDQKVRDSPGTGLGLNITKQLVELQGGHIWFESQFRQGTTFHFIMPIAEVD
jgi:signal transduction histidine kinase